MLLITNTITFFFKQSNAKYRSTLYVSNDALLCKYKSLETISWCKKEPELLEVL